MQQPEVIDERTINAVVEQQRLAVFEKRGAFKSAYEMYAVLQEELEGFWATVKEGQPNPDRLVDLMAIAKTGVLQMHGSLQEH